MTKRKVKEEVDLNLKLHTPKGAYYGNPVETAKSKKAAKAARAERKAEKAEADLLDDDSNKSDE